LFLLSFLLQATKILLLPSSTVCLVFAKDGGKKGVIVEIEAVETIEAVC